MTIRVRQELLKAALPRRTNGTAELEASREAVSELTQRHF